MLVRPLERVGDTGSTRPSVAFQRSGAARGVVVTAGVLHVLDVRRREAFAPQFLHIGPDGIQHMADAVAVGADPFDFAVLPV